MYGALGIWSRPADELVASFEDDYTHRYLPLVRQVPHVTSVELVRSDPAHAEDDQLYRIGTMWFEDESAYAAASTTAEWAAMFACCDALVEQYALALRYALVVAEAESAEIGEK